MAIFAVANAHWLLVQRILIFLLSFFLVSVAAAGTFEYLKCMCNLYVVVQFYPWFEFLFSFFGGMVMYDNDMIMSLKQKKI